MRAIFYAAVLFVTFGLTVLILRFLIPFLKSKKMGQKILEIGPRWHKSKEGTPAMGGLSFIAATLIVMAVALPLAAVSGVISNVGGILLALGYALINGLIGVIDDTAKFKKGENKGLSALQKYLLQLVAASAFFFVGVWLKIIPGRPEDFLHIPFAGDVLPLSNIVVRILYYVFSLVLLTGMVNAVNLTDGIDGLSSSVTLVVGLFYTAASTIALSVVSGFAGAEGVQLLSAAMIGGCAGFLVYNFHPAKVFMGDTGSLYLGGLVVAAAFVLRNPLIVIFCGFVYIMETLSVILQVGYFKLTHGKRLFKMSPIHHHFEKCGWSEVKIVAVFSAAAFLLCAVGIVDYILTAIMNH